MTCYDWFGVLPDRWSSVLLGHCFDVALGKMLNASKDSGDGSRAPYLAAGSIQPEHLILDEAKTMTFSDEELVQYDLRKHDIVVVEGGAGYGRSHLLRDNLPGWGFQNHVARLRARGSIAPGFLLYCLKVCLASGYIEANNRTATLPSLSRDVLRSIPIPLPSLNEQYAIADHLDRETLRIDTLVEEQQRLIDMLRERRRAVAQHAIYGQIPSGAVTDKLGRSAHIGNGSTPRRESAAYWDGGEVPWLNSSVVNESRVTHADQFVTPVALRECHLPLVAPGSVLVGLTGQGKTRGTATILDIEATVNQHVAYVTPNRDTWFPEYLLWSLRASYGELRRLSEENGSTKGGLTCEALKQFRLPVPALDEQRRIAAYLNEQTARIDALIAETERFIELGRERRVALMAAAVTGKIDVREMV